MSDPVVTDHAVLRYLQRAYGVDVEAARVQIAELCAPAMRAGALHFRVNGVKFAFNQERTIVTTALPDGQMPSRIGKAKMALVK